jgi:hypothetical protein
MATKTYNAVSGTGWAASAWTAGGATIGDDQSGDGGTASTSKTMLAYLHVYYAKEADAGILASTINSVQCYITAKSAYNNYDKLAPVIWNGTDQLMGDASVGLTLSYANYSSPVWTTDASLNAWTWTEFNKYCNNAAYFIAWSLGPISGAWVSCDHSWLVVDYTLAVAKHRFFFFGH